MVINTNGLTLRFHLNTSNLAPTTEFRALRDVQRKLIQIKWFIFHT